MEAEVRAVFGCDSSAKYAVSLHMTGEQAAFLSELLQAFQLSNSWEMATRDIMCECLNKARRMLGR